MLGAGAIYPIAEDEITCKPFELPDYWPRCYALDVGWNRTAALWGAHDREGDIVYLYSEHYQGQAEAPVHATAIKARGIWIPGVVDPAARGRAQADGKQLLKLYKDTGLDLGLAINAIEAGIQEVWLRLSSGRLKVFTSLLCWLSEYRQYARDEDGKIPDNSKDHLMDCTRYLAMSGLKRAMTQAEADYHYGRQKKKYQAADAVAGY